MIVFKIKHFNFFPPQILIVRTVILLYTDYLVHRSSELRSCTRLYPFISKFHFFRFHISSCGLPQICEWGSLTFTVILVRTLVSNSVLYKCCFSTLSFPSPVPKLLVDLHVKLLRKIGKSVSADRWEKYLVKVNVHISVKHSSCDVQLVVDSLKNLIYRL